MWRVRAGTTSVKPRQHIRGQSADILCKTAFVILWTNRRCNQHHVQTLQFVTHRPKIVSIVSHHLAIRSMSSRQLVAPSSSAIPVYCTISKKEENTGLFGSLVVTLVLGHSAADMGHVGELEFWKKPSLTFCGKM